MRDGHTEACAIFRSELLGLLWKGLTEEQSGAGGRVGASDQPGVLTPW